MLTIEERRDRLDTFRNERRLIRRSWRGQDATGRETACLLVALSPECGDGDASRCPADVMPEWFARLTVWIDDAGTGAAWPATIERYAALARRWHVLTLDAWTRLEYVARGEAVREAMRHTTNERSLAVCATSLALCERAAKGDMPAWAEFRAARVRAAGAKAAGAAGAAAEGAGEAAWAGAWAAGAGAGAGAAAAWAAAGAEARQQSADRLASVILGAIEAACDEAEAR